MPRGDVVFVVLFFPSPCRGAVGGGRCKPPAFRQGPGAAAELHGQGLPPATHHLEALGLGAGAGPEVTVTRFMCVFQSHPALSRHRPQRGELEVGRSSLSPLCAQVSKWALYLNFFCFWLPPPQPTSGCEVGLGKVFFFYFGDESAQPSMLLLGSKQYSLLWGLTQLALSPKPYRPSARQTYPVCRVAPSPITNFTIFLISVIF